MFDQPRDAKIIVCLWLDIIKCDEPKPFYRNRIVGLDLKDQRSTSADNVSQLQSFLTTVQCGVLEPCASGKHARCAQCTFRERVVTPSANRKVFIELLHGDEQEGCIGQLLRVFYARRRVNFRRQDLCLLNRLLPHLVRAHGSTGSWKQHDDC